MKKIVTIPGLALLSLLTINAASAAETCADKRAAIEKELSYARQHNNTGKIAGLQKALTEVNAHCTRSSVRNDAIEQVNKAQKKLTKQQDELQKAERELSDAMARGKQDKISKYQDKVAEKKKDVEAAIRRLNQAEGELSPLR